MPPLLAAFLCSGFVLFLFYCNAKGKPDVSAALWIPTLWVAIIASKPASAWFYGDTESDASAYIEGDAFNRNLFLILIFAGLVILARRRFVWGTFWAENRWLLALYIFTLISVVWSDYPFVAFKRWTRIVGSLIMIQVIFTERNPVEAVRQVFVRCAYFLIPLSILVIKYYLETGVYFDEWTGVPCYCGVTTDKNALGRLAWVSIAFLLWSLDSQGYAGWFQKIRGRWWEALLLVLCVGLLIKSQSATSLFCFLVATVVYFISRTRWVKTNPKYLAFFASVLILLSLLFLGTPALRKAVTEALGRNPTLTERTVIWDAVLDLKTNPVIGEGFASFWLTGGGVGVRERLKAHEAHNGYLETYLNTGLIGVVLLFAVLLSAGRNTLRQMAAGSPIGLLYGALFLGGVFYNYTETAINDSSLVGFLFWQLASWHRLQPKTYPPGRPAAAGR